MTAHTEDERIWGEWLSLYLDHCRRELSARQLAELAQALERGVDHDTGGEFAQHVTARVATVSRPLVDFISTAPNAALGAALLATAILRLQAFARVP